MAYPPSFDTTIRDGQLGLTSDPNQVPLVVGISSSGTAGLSLQTDPNDTLDVLGYGPLTECGLPVMEAAGSALFLKLTGSVAAVPGTITPTRIGTSVGTIAVSGTPNRDYRGIVYITRTTSALGEGKFQYSLDNGNTRSEEITIPSGGTYVLPNSGLTLTFALQSGTPDFELGDVFTWTSTCAFYNTTDLGTGITTLLASPLLIGRKIQKVFFTGVPATASAAATLAAAIATHMATLESRDHFARALMDCGSSDTTVSVLSDFVTAFSDTRVAACYGKCEMVSPAPIAGFGLGYVSIVNPVAVRATEAEMSENLGRVLSGPLRGVKATTLSQDEERNTAFAADNKIITLRTNRNKPGGVYITNGYLKSPVGSDFIYWDYGITLDRACEVLVAGLTNWTLAKLRALTNGSGNLDPRSALTVRASIEPILGSLMTGPTKDGQEKHVSGQQLSVATNYNFISERKLRVTYRMVPLVPVEGGSITVGLTRELDA